jgi:hypothetical protein
MSKSVPQLNAITSAAAGDLLHIVRSNVDKKIDFTDFRNSITSTTNNTVWVDAIYGNNATGALENQAKPYQTITAAQTAAVAASGSWNIQINNGSYTDTNLGATLMNYIFAPGAVLTSTTNCFRDNGVTIVFNVFGNGIFTCTGTGTDAILNLTAASIVNFEGFYCTSSARGFSSTSTDAPRMNVKIKDYIYTEGILIHLTSSASDFPVITVECNIAETQLTMIETTGAQDYGTVNLIANKILLNGAATPEYLLNQNGGSVNMHGPCFVDFSTGFPCFFIQYAVFTNIYGDFDGICNVTADVSSGICNFYGTISNWGVITASTGGTLKLHNELINRDGSSSNYAISVTGGTLIVKDRIVNQQILASGHGILVSSGTLILDGATVVTTHASAESINASSAKNIKIYSAVANKAMSVNITNIITGTSMIVDTDVS